MATGAVDVQLRKDGIIRVYDVLFPADVLYKTDEWVYRVMMAPEFRKRISGIAELHHQIGKYALETAHTERVARSRRSSPPRTSSSCRSGSPSPGDSTIGLNFSAIYTAEPDRGPHVDPADRRRRDVGARARRQARTQSGLSGVLILGGGAPKNFLLQTEPQLQEILGVAEKGHDFFIQVTDARPDTGGLSGATPAEAVSWGKIDPEKLPDTVVAYVDSTIALPLIAAYVIARCKPREPRRLMRKIPSLMEKLRSEYRTTDLYKKYWG